MPGFNKINQYFEYLIAKLPIKKMNFSPIISFNRLIQYEYAKAIGFIVPFSKIVTKKSELENFS